MNAGKVMRLNIPKTTRKARRPEEKMDDRCCPGVKLC